MRRGTFLDFLNPKDYIFTYCPECKIKMTPENCPACGKELTELRDFPRVEVKSVELQTLPNEVLRWRSKLGVHPLPKIDISEENRAVVNSEPVQEYLDTLGQKSGSEVESSEILPPFEEGMFPWAFAIPDSSYFLSINNEEGKEDVARVRLWGHGPNMGSAGGPTLQAYVDLAKIEFKGKLLAVPTV